MKILFDHQVFILQQFGGISKYHYDLIKYLRFNKVNSELSVLLSNNYYLRNKDISSHHGFFPSINLKIRNEIINKTNTIFSSKKIKERKFDIFHPTYYDCYFLDSNLLKGKPFVITIHDMILEKFHLEGDVIPKKKKLMEEADKIIAISESTKKDILNYTNIDENKIEVIHQCITINTSIQLPQKIKNKNIDRYILFVGSRDSYKNFNRLAEAFSMLSEKYPDLKLICTGSAFSQIEMEMLFKLKIANNILHLFASEEELNWLYKNATLFVFPSLYEGFGLPILEAFSMCCPIAISNASCFPEIAGDAAYYFEPKDVYSIYSAMDKILSDSSLKNELIKKGKKRLSFFSQEKRAILTTNLYQKLC